MKAVSVRSAVLALGVLLSSACGEAPTSPQLEAQSSSGSALVCDGSTTTPVLSISDQDIHYECTGPEIGNVWYAPEATAWDTCEGSIPVHRYNTGDDDEDGVPGSEDPDDFGPGPTTEFEGLTYVQYLASDASGNTTTASLSVYVHDTIPPVLTLNGPEYLQVECATPDPDSPQQGGYVDPGASALDRCYGDVSSQIVMIGAVNPQVPGLYTLEYQAADMAESPNWTHRLTRTVEVIDSLPPVVTAASLPLAPADGTMRTLQLSQCAMATDGCEGPLDPNLHGGIVSITSDAPNDEGDIVFEPEGSTFTLRAEPNPGGAARTYTVQFTLSDSSGNPRLESCTVVVPAGP